MDNSSPHSSRRNSFAGSAYSQAASTRHILSDPADMGYATPKTLAPSPFNSLRADSTGVSLSVNYVPHKFSDAMLGGSTRKRRNNVESTFGLPKFGGGVDAFKSGESRIPGLNDEDDAGGLGGKNPRTGRRSRWTRFKWILFFANILLSGYAIVALIFCLLTWFNIWNHADIVRVGNRPELVLSTIAASLGIFTSLIGWAGILLNNRGFLAWYTLLLWICLAFMCAPGYITYKKRTFNLEGKINAQWSRGLGSDGRLRIQDELQCCGYFSPFIEATVSATCYARSVLPGCKLPYMTFERRILQRWYIVVFSVIALHIGIIITALLCSNHVTYRFGKGMMPKAYRLSMDSMAVVMDNYAQQLAQQHGPEAAKDILARSTLNMNLSTSELSTPVTTIHGHAKYESLTSRPN
ncbi:hypothetical protein Agabi119p4_9 [Agaricus bisporus var. burnettii]|uniref:Tetraspanin Tsp2 n=1 Tax=Agaricus bisporus var. burnettii TaxID=192524 RepID=A0A8H7F9X8_AGABI|nr:hypothetical protein Agabi119p4_9 [Agaricus bisporus var. burnettii]